MGDDSETVRVWEALVTVHGRADAPRHFIMWCFRQAQEKSRLKELERLESYFYLSGAISEDEVTE